MRATLIDLRDSTVDPSGGSLSEIMFSLLGPLEVRSPAGQLKVDGARRRMLLLRLLVSANRPVPAEVLVDDVWGDDATSGAASTLQSHASLLRKVLGPDRIVNSNGGYQLNADRAEV